MGFWSRLLTAGVQSIAPSEAARLMADDARLLVVDVRQPMETKSGAIPGAVLIPLTQFADRLGELPRDRPILTICRSGHRSPLAARQLKRAGYDVTNIQGGMLAWEKAGLPVARGAGGAGAG